MWDSMCSSSSSSSSSSDLCDIIVENSLHVCGIARVDDIEPGTI